MDKACGFAADCHLAPQAWAKRAELCGDAYHSFAQLCQYAQEHLELLILAGDILDTPSPDPTTLSQLLAGVQNAGCEIWFITGQHDQHLRGRWLALAPQAKCINEEQVTWQDHKFYGLNWHSRTVIKAKLAAIPEGTAILVAHQVWGELCPNFECSGSDAAHVRQLWTGDFHQHLHLTTTNAAGQPLQLYSPGSLAMQAVDEPAGKYFYSFDKQLQPTSIQVQTRAVYQYELQTLDDLQQMLATEIPWEVDLPATLQRPIAWIHFNDQLPQARQALEERFAESTHLFLKPLRQRPATPAFLPTAREHGSLDLLHALPDFVPETDPVYEILVRVLETEGQPADLRRVLADLWAKAGQVPEDVK